MMKSLYENIDTASMDEMYDNFLCLSKKCKQRKKERHEARIEKKQLKNDQRRAETEAMRAETAMVKSMSQPRPVPAITPVNPQVVMASPKPVKAGLAGNSMLIVVGLILAGGFVYMQMKKHPQGVQ